MEHYLNDVVVKELKTEIAEVWKCFQILIEHYIKNIFMEKLQNYLLTISPGDTIDHTYFF